MVIVVLPPPFGPIKSRVRRSILARIEGAPHRAIRECRRALLIVAVCCAPAFGR